MYTIALLLFLSLAGADEGVGVDPFGLNGAALNDGAGLDPHGRPSADEGVGIDPWG